MLVLLMLVMLLTLSDLLNSIARKVLCAVVAYGLTSPPPLFRVSAIKGGDLKVRGGKDYDVLGMEVLLYSRRARAEYIEKFHSRDLATWYRPGRE